MRRLWISDVHANYPAFEAVLSAAGTFDEIVFLGDVVGYGPHPRECVHKLMDLNAKAVMGNHDSAVLAVGTKSAHPDSHIEWDTWTYAQLEDTQLDYLASLPEQICVNFSGTPALAMHHPNGVPYTHPSMSDSVLAKCLKPFSHRLMICGHSHRAIDRIVDGHRYICIPPIGQPRNRDPRAAYALEDEGALSFHYVEYDLERTASDIRSIGLPDAFCERWIRFLRTAYDSEWSREYYHDSKL